MEGGGSRLTRIEGLERAAEAAIKLGRRREALDFYNQSLELAGTRAYRAEMLFTTAALLQSLGEEPLPLSGFERSWSTTPIRRARPGLSTH